MQILDLLGMYFDALVVEFKTFLLLFRLTLAILCGSTWIKMDKKRNTNIDQNGSICIKIQV